ncbi:MAG TPA: alpha-amylase/4-alpha-glucanotransferase domain-containing protein [Pirellulaceae bacterium]|nr:alpha-amylase/4-alpha-glucanotransferase domain-containing protein [Pirellulaceae bacterium]
MTQPIRFCLVLHNHQPIGNFDGVFEQAYQDSYLPFLEVFEPYTDLKISLHTSGPLMEWLDDHHSEYLDRLAALVEAGRVEIIGGSFYEAILTMIPSRDRVGQISDYTRWLEQRLNATVQGLWVPERVWEQSMASDIADAGIKYTVLDDFHFKNAGLDEDELNGYFVTEDDGRTLNVFPGSERLRYLIPFGAPHETVDYLRGIAERHPGAVVTFGDDGEKFGTWPDTKKHVYDDGWLRRFFDELVKNRDWINTTTLADAARSTPPVGKIYLPDGSYREMTEWVLAADQQVEYENITHEMHDDPRWQRLVRFVRGGYWRNFKVKYPEANEMYSRMLQVSRRLAEAEARGGSSDELNWARRELYRGQCNCGYWHGAFGGIYLPHLRNAVYNHLIAADNLLDQAAEKPAHWIEATAGDYNFDGQQEVRLANDRVVAFLAPLAGGHLYELDVRSICHNLLATLTRRPEAYHRKVLAGANQDNSLVASIHDRVVFKQEGLDQRLQYDSYPRKSLVDHFYDDDASLQTITSGDADERGDFRDGGFETKLRKGPDRVQVLMSRDGNAFGIPIKLTKGLTLNAGSHELEIAYLLENLPQDRTLHFSVEFNFAGLPSGADDRYFYQVDHTHRHGQLGTQLDLFDADDLGLVDEWLGIDVHWSADRPTNVWTFPIESVSQSEGGFELVHQSVVVQPHWHVRGDAHGRWAITMRLALGTSLAESRAAQVEVGAALAH